MSLDNILKIQRERKYRRNLIYGEIYDKVKIRIDHYVKFGKTYCIYEIPYIIYGQPHINFGEIANYLENKLKKEGFGVYRMTPNSLYITWEEAIIDLINKKKYEKSVKRKEDNYLDSLTEQRNNDLMKSLANTYKEG